MREKLGKRDGERMRFRATVQRYGTCGGWKGAVEITILLTEICFATTGEQACDLWFRAGQWADDLRVGTTFEFDARVDAYVKGYQGRRAEELGLTSFGIDYHLERPTKVTVIARADCAAA